MTELTVLEHVFVPLEFFCSNEVDKDGNKRPVFFLKNLDGSRSSQVAQNPRVVARGYYSVMGGVSCNVDRAPDFNAVLVGKPILFERLPSDFKPKFAESHKRQSNYWPVTFYQIDERQAENYRVRRAFASRDK